VIRPTKKSNKSKDAAHLHKHAAPANQLDPARRSLTDMLRVGDQVNAKRDLEIAQEWFLLEQEVQQRTSES